MDKFFELYVGLPKNFREVEGFQVSFQKFLKEDKKSVSEFIRSLPDQVWRGDVDFM
jgi:hypothetical protein